jgi:DnaD/phage-associated family protein
MRYILPGSDTITLSGQTADKLIRAGDGVAALLYLYALRTGGIVSLRRAAEALGIGEKEIAASMELLGRLGLLKNEEPAPPLQKDELPDYTAADIKNELENGSVFAALVKEIQKLFDKLLTSDDLIKLFGIYDHLGLPPEVILQLAAYCLQENRRRYGPGRVPTMRYVEKNAYTWEREGVLSLEQAEQYIKTLEEKRSLTGEVKRVLQINDRALSSGERKYVESWIARGFSPEAIELAYDRTVLKTGKLAWSYMDSIIMSWHSKGLYTADEIRAKDGKNASVGKKTNPAKPAGASKPSQAELDHMKKFLEKLREE